MPSITPNEGKETTKQFLIKVLKEHEPVSLSDWVVEAWKLDQQTMGLAGFEEQHPDTRKLVVLLYGKKGLLRSGEVTLDKINRLFAFGKDKVLEETVAKEPQVMISPTLPEWTWCYLQRTNKQLVTFFSVCQWLDILDSNGNLLTRHHLRDRLQGWREAFAGMDALHMELIHSNSCYRSNGLGKAGKNDEDVVHLQKHTEMLRKIYSKLITGYQSRFKILMERKSI